MINYVRVFLFFIIFSTPSLAVTFKQVVNETLKNNIELKILNTTQNINKAIVKQTDALFYPVIYLNVNSNYTKDLSNNKSVFTAKDNTQYATSSNLKLDYDLYDFNIRNTKRTIKILDEKQVKYTILQKQEELKLTLLDIYSKIQINQMQIKYNNQVQVINTNIYNMLQRLYKAHKIDKITLANQAISIIELNKTLQEFTQNLKQNLKHLSFYTKNSYFIDDKFESIKIIINKNKSYEDNFLYKQYNLKIQQKNKEISLLKNELYPVIKLYSTYNLYKSHENHFENSFKLKEQNYVVGFSINVNLFNGYMYDATKQKLKAELKQIQLQNQYEKESFYKEQKELKLSFDGIKKDVNILNKNKMKNDYKTQMISRLSKIKNIDQISKEKNTILNIQSRLKLDISHISLNINQKKMQLLGVKIPSIVKQKTQIVSKTKKQKIIFSSHIKQFTHTIDVKVANIRNTPFQSGNIVKILGFGNKINISSCNIYNWCKIKNKEQYVARFLLRKNKKD